MLHITLSIHTTKHLKSHHGIPHHTAISCHHFTPYALLHYTILHHFTLCSPSRPQTFHTIQHTIPHHTLQQIFCSIIEICPQDPPILLCTLDYFPCVCQVVCHWFHACVCTGHIPHHECCSVYVISRTQIAFHITLLNSTPH